MSPNETHDCATYYEEENWLLSETMVPFMAKVRVCKATHMLCQRKARTSLT